MTNTSRLEAMNFSQKIKEATYEHYQVAGKYLNREAFVLFFHQDCGSYFSETPNQFLAGNRCPHCEDIGKNEI